MANVTTNLDDPSIGVPSRERACRRPVKGGKADRRQDLDQLRNGRGQCVLVRLSRGDEAVEASQNRSQFIGGEAAFAGC